MSAHMWEFCGIVHVACLYMQVIGFNSEEEELWPEIDFWVGRVKFLFKEK